MNNTNIIKSADFVLSIADIDTYSASDKLCLPEVCVVGRSNVGKSSFINMLTGRKKLAKTSQTPGRTRLLNFFELLMQAGDNTQKKLFLVDLPGYGYASANKQEKEKWSNLIEDYFRTVNKVKHILALVDIRHNPSELDKQMIKFLYMNAIPFTVIATKADKISKSQLVKHIQVVASALGLGKDNIIATSAENGLGRQAVIDKLVQAVSD